MCSLHAGTLAPKILTADVAGHACDEAYENVARATTLAQTS
jgi:hypothetical protein